MKRIILDTNLLVLLVVGSTDERLIRHHKRTSFGSKSSTPEVFRLLNRKLENYQQIVVTPHILAETSNLLAQGMSGPDRSRVMRKLGLLIGGSDGGWEEVQRASKDAADSEYFVRLGLTDSLILEIMRAGLPLLTADFQLYLAALDAGLDTENFNHLRDSSL